MADALRIVALDLGTRAAGIAWTHDRTGTPAIGCTTVHTDGLPLHRRIHRVLEDVEVAVRCRPHLVVVEGTFSRPGGSDAPLHMLRGVILHWLWSRRPSIPYVDVAPATVKVWATGSGATSGENKVTKQAVKEAVIATYGRLVHVATYDEADAVALASLGCYAYGQPLVSGLRSQQTRALSSVRWPDLVTESGPVVPVVGTAVSGGAAGNGRRPARTRAGAR